MKGFQNKFVRSLPTATLFLIAAYNFGWVYAESLDPLAGRGIAGPWFSTKDFPFAQLLLFVAAYLLFIPRKLSYLLSALISGYFTASWAFLIVKWLWITDYSLELYLEIIMSQYFGHPLQIWETQFVIAAAIFLVSLRSLVKAFAGRKSLGLS